MNGTPFTSDTMLNNLVLLLQDAYKLKEMGTTRELRQVGQEGIEYANCEFRRLGLVYERRDGKLTISRITTRK